MKSDIRVTVKTIPHPEPHRLIDLWANVVVAELLRREESTNEH